MDPTASRNSFDDAPRAERLARILASPLGVLILVPALVIAAGVSILLLGRGATRDATGSMAREQLRLQAHDVQHEVAAALDQAAPVLARLRELADPAHALEDIAPSMRDLQLGRPGVVNLSIGYATGNLRGTFFDGDELRMQESIVGASATQRTNYRFTRRGLEVIDTKQTDYDVRKRPHYTHVATERTAVWTAPKVYFTSSATGISAAAPVYRNTAPGSEDLHAVVTVDFDVSALSKLVVRAPPLPDARSVMFTRDGTVLAYPTATALPEAAMREKRLLHYRDFGEPALDGLFAALGDRFTSGHHRITELTMIDVATPSGTYLASVAPIAGQRAGITAPIDWYLATLVPERVLFAPSRRFQLWSLVASAVALAISVLVALVFAWNLVRMRRAVGAARQAARDAEARARELGSYRLVERLGEGGMGEVWRAEHRLLARQAAVKLVKPETMRDPAHAAKLRERFRREAQTLASMRSRHTIALYDYGVSSDDDGPPTFFFVMELLDGLDLDRLVDEHGAIPAARAIHLLLQACQSLAEAHDAGLVHRDIKPANLFICREADEVDIVKVLDFGIVQSLVEPPADPTLAVTLPAEIEYSGQHKLTRVDAVVGTAGYIAPEHVFGEPVDARGDLYSLGCVAWWLLTGGEVFVRKGDTATLLAHAHDPLPPLAPRVVGWLPPELEQLVLACLAKHPAERPASARELAARLRAIAIPPEHAWTEDRARAWWFVHRPAAGPSSSPHASSSSSPGDDSRTRDTEPAQFLAHPSVASRRQ